MSKRRLGFLVLAIAVCVAFPAMANDKEEAKSLFESGLKLMKLEDFTAATANFERSTALFPTQNSLFNLANCYQAMRRYGDALATLERLDHDFGKTLKPEIKSAAARREAEIRSITARLTIQIEPIDASLTVDGKDTGTGSLRGPLVLAPGEHVMEATKPGYQPQRRVIQLVSEKAQTERFGLEAARGPTSISGTTPAPAQTSPVVVSKAPDVSPETDQAPKPGSHTLRVVTWSALAGSLAAGAVAGTFWLIASGHYSDFQKYNTGDPTLVQKRDAARSDVQSASHVAIGCGIAAAALAITAGVTYWLGQDREQDAGKRATVSVSPFGLTATF
jgi:hypothetical protein